MNKIGFVVTTHYSDICPTGMDSIMTYIDSFIKIRKDNYFLYVIDNTSVKKLSHPEMESLWFDYEYIEDQKISGLTGAWNRGVKKAVDDGCDIILNTNNDLILNESTHSLIEIISTHEHSDKSLYGPVTSRDGVSTDHQARNGIGDRLIETTDHYALNGFFNAFTKEFFNNFNVGGNLYSTNKKDMWGGQEVELHNRGKKDGMKSFIVEHCFVEHIKYRSWLSAKNKL